MGIFGDADGYEYAVNFWKFKMTVPIWLSLPYEIRHYEFRKSDNIYVISAVKNLRMQSLIEIGTKEIFVPQKGIKEVNEI